jgi:hypothetical protein
VSNVDPAWSGYNVTGNPGTGFDPSTRTVSSGPDGGGFNPLSVGALGVGAAGLGAIIGKGESPIPQQFQQLQAEVPYLQSQAAWMQGQGASLLPGAQALTAQGTSALGMAQRGELTQPQQAQLGQYRTGLTNQARQTFANMGRNPDQDTSFINQTADIDAQVNAMAQQQIQSTIALGLGELSAGSSMTGEALSFETGSLGFENAASQALVQAGQAQISEDKAYSDSLTSAFSAIGKLFGTFAGGAIGGPAGAAVGGAVGSAV